MFKPNAGICRREGLVGVSPQARLVVSLLESCKSDGSGGGGGVGDGRGRREIGTWEATWPSAEDFEASMPLCWTSEFVDRYLPESALGPIQRQRADYARDWEAVKGFCELKGWSEEVWRYYWCIVNSRSFHWKPPGGKAGSMVLCPFVDYLNHAPTGEGCLVMQGPEGYEVVAGRDYGEFLLCSWSCSRLVLVGPYNVTRRETSKR